MFVITYEAPCSGGPGCIKDSICITIIIFWKEPSRCSTPGRSSEVVERPWLGNSVPVQIYLMSLLLASKCFHTGRLFFKLTALILIYLTLLGHVFMLFYGLYMFLDMILLLFVSHFCFYLEKWDINVIHIYCIA